MRTSTKLNRAYFPEEDNVELNRYVYYFDEKRRSVVQEDVLSSEVEAKASSSDVVLYLRTRNGNDSVGVGINDAASFPSYFDSSKPIVFLIHGWNNDYQSSLNVIVTPALLNHADVNVIVVDWSKIANKNYLTAAWAVNDIGEFVAQFADSLSTLYNVKRSQMNCIGHSLGAHVCGSLGASLNGEIDQIIGLDPASPLFTVSNTDGRVDTTDSQFVHIIHTSGGFLGFKSSIGHADYFPNGGSSQPGCGIDLVGSCAHSRAYQFFADSLNNGQFVSRQCDSYSDLNKESCSDKAVSLMGGFLTDNT